jgi:hypothetical protein
MQAAARYHGQGSALANLTMSAIVTFFLCQNNSDKVALSPQRDEQ